MCVCVLSPIIACVSTVCEMPWIGGPCALMCRLIASGNCLCTCSVTFFGASCPAPCHVCVRSLSQNNPSDFSYFYVTDEQRICYLAPERFVETKTIQIEVPVGRKGRTRKRTIQVPVLLDAASVQAEAEAAAAAAKLSASRTSQNKGRNVGGGSARAASSSARSSGHRGGRGEVEREAGEGTSNARGSIGESGEEVGAGEDGGEEEEEEEDEEDEDEEDEDVGEPQGVSSSFVTVDREGHMHSSFQVGNVRSHFYDADAAGGARAAAVANTPPSASAEVCTFAMDIFSAGCILAELFLNGQHLFQLPDLLAYRKGNVCVVSSSPPPPLPFLNKICSEFCLPVLLLSSWPDCGGVDYFSCVSFFLLCGSFCAQTELLNRRLEAIDCVEARSLIRHMVHVNAADRLTARDCLVEGFVCSSAFSFCG